MDRLRPRWRIFTCLDVAGGAARFARNAVEIIFPALIGGLLIEADWAFLHACIVDLVEEAAHVAPSALVGIGSKAAVTSRVTVHAFVQLRVIVVALDRANGVVSALTAEVEIAWIA